MATAQSIRETAATLAAAYHVKGELVQDGAMLHGWCWSPARPQERLMVELLRDDEKIATAVAARLRLDLVRDNVCDGYHGFSFQMPLAPFARIEVREVATGQAFGRVLGERAAQWADWDERIGSLADALMRAHTIPLRHCPPRSAPYRDFGAQTSAGLRLPAIAAPAFTLLLDADASAQLALAAVHRLAPLLRTHHAELLLVDAGRSPASAALASIPGLMYIRNDSTNAAARFNAALSHARGARVMLLCTGQMGLGDGLALGVHALLANPPAAQEIVMSAALLPIADQTSPGILPSPVSLYAAREAFAAVGDFDLSCDDGSDLVILEFALRARALGHALITLPAASHKRLPGGDAPFAREHFREILGKMSDV